MNGLNKTAKNIQGLTICAFGEARAWPVLSFVNIFQQRGSEFDLEFGEDSEKNGPRLRGVSC
jgi:NADH:ubiquinone oxidoreductase subunit F (NADH-binding)